jgi:hypothetical protein
VARALAAARAVALAHGLACDDAAVLSAHSNVLVHLKPAPVVARVMTGTAVLHDDPRAWLTRELAVGRFLAERGLAVPPTDVPAPGPHCQDGIWMTLWRFVEHDPSAGLPSARELGGALRDLHAALAGFDGELTPLSGIRDWLDGLLTRLDDPSSTLPRADVDRLRAQLHALTPTVFDAPLPAQALHGDMSISNLLRTRAGLVWNDLEDVCAGPVEWDVAGLVTSARARGQGERFVADLLDAYGGPSLEELEPFIAAHDLYAIVWQAYDRQRPR